jgi:hypothetical protein
MLIKLYQATAASTVDAIDAFSSITSGWYLPRYDAVWYAGSSGLGSIYRIFRSGLVVRMCGATSGRYYGYDADIDRVLSHEAGVASVLHDPVGQKYDPAAPATLTYTGLSASSHNYPFVWRGAYYTIVGAVVTKRNLATGASEATYTLTGALTWFGGGRIHITPEGVLVAWVDNGTYTVVRFYDLPTNTNLYESCMEQMRFVFVDAVHHNIWGIRLADSLMQVYSFDVAPYTFNPFTMGANKSRYRQDVLSGTLLGAQGEPVRFWPVGWRLTQPSMGGGFLGDLEVGYGALGSNGSLGPSAEGHLEHEWTLTDENGVTENLYCGPGSVDYVGQSATIEAWTGY